tara:strand:- start:2091 stop:2201 length:111 start_codon:yes stop_codon:yes gene_type:complete
MFDKFVSFWTGMKRSMQIIVIALAIIAVMWLWGIVF